MIKASKATAIIIMALCMALTMIPMTAPDVHAESTAATGNTETGTVKTAGTTDTQHSISISVYLGSKKSTAGGNALVSDNNISSGGAVTITSTANKGYSLRGIYINDKLVSTSSSYQYTLDENDLINNTLNIKAVFEKTGLFIMLDPGHAAYYNRGYYRAYWESHMTWQLYKYLASDLNSYPGIVCKCTKTSLYNDPRVYKRGLMAAGCDVFISLHSNSGASSARYPLAIVSSNAALKSQVLPLAKKLASKVQTVIGTNSAYQIWQKKQHDGRDWYGVVRGSAAKGVPGMILEHSFHSNPTTCRWFLNSSRTALNKSHLKTLASQEAKVIAGYYGMTTSNREVKALSAPTVKAVSGKKAITLSWKAIPGAYGYRVYRSDSEQGVFVRVSTTRYTSTTNKYLTSKKTYYYKVRAYRDASGRKIFGSYSANIHATAK